MMGRMFGTYVISAVLFAAIDSAYLFSIGAKMFKSTLGDVMAPTVNLPPGIVFYLLFPIGLMIFAVQPAVAADRWTVALVNGALLGLFAYATYDLTNYATIRNWTMSLTVVDMIWGTVLSGATSALTFAIRRAIFGPG